jgi:hypothetical protein
MKKNKLINERDSKAALKYVTDFPSLEIEFRGSATTVLHLEIKKIELSTQLSDLGYAISQYQYAIDNKKSS